MGDFRRNDRSGGYKGKGGFNRGDRGGFHGKPSFKPDWKRPHGEHGFGHSGSVELFDATCANCGKTCQVPFRPNGKKPVYCKECFAGASGGERSHAPARDFDRAPRQAFAPRPAFQETKSSDETKRQFEVLNSKLDRLIRVVETMRAAESTATPKTPAQSEALTEAVAAVVKKPAKKETKTAKKKSAKKS